MQQLPIKKGWLITIAIALLFIILNPGYTSFRQFTGDTSVRRTYNFFICSIYDDGGDKYLGIALNFFRIN